MTDAIEPVVKEIQLRRLERFVVIAGSLLMIVLALLIGATAFSALYMDGYADYPLCLRSKCLKDFVEGFEYPISLVKISGACIVGLSTVLGLVVALRVYVANSAVIKSQADAVKVQAGSLVEQAKSAALQLHSVRFSSFRDYVIEELSRCSRIGPECVDVTTWYFKIHPLSISGDISFNEFYIQAVQQLAEIMRRADEKVNNKQKFIYKEHQERVIDMLREVGIRLDSLPRIDFFLVEDEVVWLISSVHRVFGAPTIDFGVRRYREVL